MSEQAKPNMPTWLRIAAIIYLALLGAACFLEKAMWGIAANRLLLMASYCGFAIWIIAFHKPGIKLWQAGLLAGTIVVAGAYVTVL